MAVKKGIWFFWCSDDCVGMYCTNASHVTFANGNHFNRTAVGLLNFTSPAVQARSLLPCSVGLMTSSLDPLEALAKSTAVNEGVVEDAAVACLVDGCGGCSVWKRTRDPSLSSSMMEDLGISLRGAFFDGRVMLLGSNWREFLLSSSSFDAGSCSPLSVIQPSSTLVA